MPDIKTKYNNGAIVEKKWTEQAIMPQRWTNQAIMPQKWTDQAIMPTPYTDATSYFTGTRYTYSPDKEKEKESYLSNYNDPKELNSLRDILLGAANPNMKHSLPQNALTRGFSILNIIPDTLQHAYKHYITPTIKGDVLTTGLNVLQGLSEDLDVLANPVKAVVISAYKGDDVGQALLRSTVGDETGIHNYDYDTGNWALDFLLELFSDPMFVTGVGTGVKATKAAAETTTKASVKATAMLTTDASRATLKRAIKGFSKLGKGVSERVLKESVIESIKKLPLKDIIKNNSLWKEYVNASTKELKREVLKKVIRSNAWDEIATAYNKQFNQVLSRELSKRTNIDSMKILKHLDKSDGYYKILYQTVSDVVGEAYDSTSAKILSSIYNKVHFIDDAYTSTLFKVGLTPVGVYPLWRIVKSTRFQDAIHLTTMNRVQQRAVTRNLTAAESFLNVGNKKGYAQKIDKEYTLRALFDETSKTLGPQEALDHLGPYLHAMHDDIIDILGREKSILGRFYSYADKEEAILNVLQSFDSYHKIYSVDDFIAILEQMQKQAKQYNGNKIILTGLEDYIDQFKQLKAQLSSLKNAEKAQKALTNMMDDVLVTQLLKQFEVNHIFDNYSIKQVINAIDYQEMLNVLGISNELISQLKFLKTANEELFKRTNRNANKVLKVYQASDPLNRNAIIELLARNINRVQMGFEYKWIGHSFINSDIKYLSGVIEGLRHVKGYSAKDNWDKLINTLQKMVSDPEYTLDGFINYKIYNKLFNQEFENRVIPLKDQVINQLKLQKDFSPSGITKFKDTPLAHYIQAVNEKYNELDLTIKQANKNIQDYTNNPNINIYDKDVLKRIEDMQQVNNVVMEHKAKLQYDFPQTIEFINKVTTDVPMLKYENYNQIQQYFDKLIQYCYDEAIHLPEKTLVSLEKIKGDLQSLNLMFDKIRKGTDDVFEAYYKQLYNIKQDLLKEYNENAYLKRIFDKPNILDTKIDLTNILYKQNPRGGIRTIESKTYKDVRALIRIALADAKENKDYDFVKDLTKEYNKLSKYIKDNKKTWDDILSPEEYQIYFRPKTFDEHSLSEIIDSISLNLDFGLSEKKILTTQTDESIIFMQLEHAAAQALLNNDIEIKKLQQNPTLREFIKQVANIDHPDIKQAFIDAGYKQDDIHVFGVFASMLTGLNNYNQFMHEIDLLTRDLPTTYKQALRTTLINLKNRNAQGISDNLIKVVKDVVYGVQGYINGTDIVSKKYNVDTLIKKYNLIPEIDKELKKANIDHTYRHGALYDTAAQILLWEKINKKKYIGVMLDIETTGLVDPTGMPKGNITEIAMMRRNSEGALEVIMDGRVRLDEEQLKLGFKPENNVLADMHITDEQYVNYHKIINAPVTEEELLQEFWTKLQELPIKTRIDTFNGNDFDWIFIDNKLNHYRITENLTKYDKLRKVYGAVFENETLRTTPNLQEVLETLDNHDFYQELAKDRVVLDKDLILNIKNLISKQTDRQLALEKYTKYTGKTPRFISCVDSDFLNNITQLMKLDELKYTKDYVSSKSYYEEFLNDYFELLEDDSVERFLKIQDMINASGKSTDIIKDNLSYELKELLLNIYDSVTYQMKQIGDLNRAWKEIPLADSLYTQDSKQRVLDLQKQLAQSLRESELQVPEDFLKILETTPATNYSQLVTAGLSDKQIIGYRKVSVNDLKQLDLTNIDVTSEVATQLDTFNRTVHRVYGKIINSEVLEQYEDQMLNMLKDIKATNIMLEATALPIQDTNVFYNYSLLEVIYHKLQAAASRGTIKGRSATQLLNTLQTKYPELSEIIGARVPLIKPSINGSKLLYDLPDYLNPKYMDYSKLWGLNNMQKNILDEIQTFIDTAEYPLANMKRIQTIGTLWKDLWETHNKTYINGVPTATTRAYQSLGKAFHKVLYAWETNAVLNLTPEDLRTYLIYANKEHILSIKKPTNTYFKNQEAFAEFAMKKDALEKLGVKWKYDANTEMITLTLDPSVKIGINKNYNKINYYTLNNEELVPITLPEISKEDLLNYLTHDIENEGKILKHTGGLQPYIEKLWKLREHLVSINPELSGHPGRLNVKEDYMHVRNDPWFPQFNTPKLFNNDNYMPYCNMDMLGELNDVMEATQYFNTDYFEALTILSNKMMHHSHKHSEYGQFILQGGLRLDSDAIQKMSEEELITMLKQTPELTLVYLKDNAKAIGGYELKKVNTYTPQIIKKAKELKATIIPYNLYAEAANAINQFTYGSYTTAIWHKVISLYKRGWLMNLGTIIRNGIDSTMKTFAEGKDLRDTMSAYTKAFDLLNKYDTVAREIKKLDAHGKYRLDLAEEYFRTKPNTLLDKDTYHFIYDFMEHSGMNTMASTLDGMFGVLMKPMSDIERISRFAMYLTLEGQGESYANIIRRITQTHFDYGLKSYGQFIAENYIPFITYVTNNISYLVHLVEENPSFLKNYFNFYQPIWDFDSYNYEELSENTSLQYQILNGNIPLKLLGYKDKTITRMVKTKYGLREQEVTNTAVLRMGSSILDAIQFFISPYYNIKEKLAPPVQLLADSVTEFSAEALGNSSPYTWRSYQDTEEKYQKDFGSVSIQALFKDPTKIVSLIPYVNTISQRYMHKDLNENLVWGSTTGERTQNDILGILSSTFGATNRWGTFENIKREYEYPKKRYSGYSRKYYPKRYYPKSYSKSRRYTRKVYPKKHYFKYPKPSKTMAGRQIYYPRSQNNYRKYRTYTPSSYYATGKTPYNNYTKFLYRAAYPNKAHNPSTVYRGNLPKLQSIPQYLHSYNGLNRYGKSKLLSWMNMSTKFKVKSTLKRQVRSHSLYK